MTRFCRLPGIVLLILLGLAARVWAGWSGGIRTVTDSGVTIEVASPAEHFPMGGYLPCWLTIKNRSGSAHTWTIHCQNRDYSERGFTDRMSSAQTLQVDDDQTGRLPLLIPLMPATRSISHSPMVSIRVDGYGVEEPSINLSLTGLRVNSTTDFVGMSSTLATPIWGSLEQSSKDRMGSTGLAGTPVDLTLLGDDWRALAGFDCLWLTEGDYTGLDAGRRLAIRHWVNQGGNLYLCTQGLAPALRPALGLPEEGEDGHPGVGYVKLIPWDGKTLLVETAESTIHATTTLRDGHLVTNATDWTMTKETGAILLNSTFLIVFIGLFAAVAGPVNLFWLAGATRRHRLFWTTPLISCAASLLLILVILLQDGFGGRGQRVMVTLLFPNQKEAVVVQEQVARTGVLLSRRFETSEDILLSPVPAGTGASKSYEQSGRAYGGDWFTSRSIQAQRAEAIVPSRAEIQLLNAGDAADGAPPVVASTVPATLREISYLDGSHHYWRGENLRTGERITLRPATAPLPLVAGGGSALLTSYEDRFRRQPGCFCAYADDGPFIATLSSIRWQKQRAVYVGPVAAAR